MRVISWAVSPGSMVVSVHYEARATPFLKGGKEWGSAPMFPSQAGVVGHWSTTSPELEGFSSGRRMRSSQRRAQRQGLVASATGVEPRPNESRESSRTPRMVVRQTTPDFVSSPAEGARPRLGAATVGRLA